MAKSNLNWQVVLTMSVVTLVSLAVMVFGWYLYLVNYDWLFPNEPDTEAWWTTKDFAALGLLGTVGLATASLVGRQLARKVVRPLAVVATAARSIAEGDFSARAETAEKGFGEAELLIADFNAMASRLERAEAELRFSNSAIAHELRTPLTILKGRLQGLADGLFTPSDDLYGSLISHVDDLARLVEDLRTLGLVNAGQLDLQLETIDLSQEAGAVIAAIEPELLDAGIVVQRDLHFTRVEVDSARIRQAMLAILDNVRRYAPRSVVRVETRSTDSIGLVRFSDTGPGLPDGTHEKVFERFWRLEASRSRAGGGTGLGLSVVRGIARAHGGDALARSRPEGGTVIEIRLPLTAASRGDVSR
ncbi:HAMP domain-containing sensor histidine kinase [Mesorhizobium sp.]|uniref:sensor histidine kinase n=1 Tax=Mesorhizobium sp. TaxID=1871066 RepID=UPI000FE9476F|nr:HAMP domain-containing sensor histidine kinase [Mesorhizobium sp.]RWM28155.1 MAG: HAMP domain-containing histidine kinase [Mesorhizobium sp.]RWM41401.1 MAG: HAMP domain-containing histidine kinase [Mesorhizobium sp.]TJV54386.1 MAG: HAMP domain-containing histidine kinase [Mesorhizobium sp.]